MAVGLGRMSLESCGTCGYALSIADHRCRHCAPSVATGSRAKPGAPMLALISGGALLFGVLVYRAFFG